MADYNAKSPLWNSDETDSRGELLEELILSNNLTILNQPGHPPTYAGNRAGAFSNIDVTLATTNLANQIHDWKVEDGQTTSDHNIVTFYISLTGSQTIQNEEETLQYNASRVNWNKFKDKLRLPDIKDGINLELLAEELQENTRNTIKKISPTKNKTRRNGGLSRAPKYLLRS